jgi:hypothetical protein
LSSNLEKINRLLGYLFFQLVLTINFNKCLTNSAEKNQKCKMCKKWQSRHEGGTDALKLKNSTKQNHLIEYMNAANKKKFK